jgi:glycolate oxidase
MTELSCGFRVGRPRVGRPRSASPPVRPAKVPPRPRSAGFPYDTTMDAAIPSAPSNAPAARAAQQSLVVSSLAKILPASCILYRGEETAPYECDALTAYRQLPLVVVIPESEAQVAAVLAACHALNVPIVARGAGTGLSGGALPHAMGVSLSLAKFNSIVKVDPAARTAVVQCGVRNLAISEAAAPYGLYYAPDPSSQIACTIGGNVAENSGGVHCLKYGLTLHNVLRVRGFTAQGEAVEFGSEAPDSAGLDLLPLVVGSEGMLAVIMEVTVRLLPRPVLARCIMASFATVESAGAAVAAVIAAGIIPAGLELMDKRMTAAAEDYVHAGYDLDAAAILLCESDGTPAEVDEEIERAIDVLNANGATRIEISRDERQRLQFWSGRKNAFPASGRMSPDYMCMDSTIPRKRLAEMLRTIGEMEGKYALRCVNVFHAGDGNLHPLILFDANDPDEMRRCELFGADILETSIKLGGTVTGEHGVGVEKLNSMCVQFSPAERAQMMAVKSAFDPAGLLNPGKVIPSLQRCAEYGKMHVHRGVLKFPDLPRF